MGKQVKVIGGTASNDKGLTSIVIPSTITIIESGLSIPNGDGSVYAVGALFHNYKRNNIYQTQLFLLVHMLFIICLI